MAYKKPQKLKARRANGLVDRGPSDIAATRLMIEKISRQFELYGFEPIETPAIEYTDALGKFLPDLDRPNEGVFSFKDDDEQWLSLRYDLTAPLARYVAENYQNLPLPYRSYRHGWVFRNEKPGPGRFRQFMQFDADTVGTPTPAADAEMCMLAADTMEALGIPRGGYIVKVNNRKLLDGLLDQIGLDQEHDGQRRLDVLRALDKFDRLGEHGVRQLLGSGRQDESGAFTRGALLNEHQIHQLMILFELNPQSSDYFENLPEWEKQDSSFVDVHLDRHTGRLVRQVYPEFKPGRIAINNQATISLLQGWAGSSPRIDEALSELSTIANLVRASGYGSKRIIIDPSVVRGLGYYTGPVYEVELLFETMDEKGRPVRFGSVGGGGRYDGLVSRFRGEPVPATGFSIGVSRLMAALETLNRTITKKKPGPVVVTIMDRDRVDDYQRLAKQLRDAGIPAELYLGNPKNNLGTQLKYADRRNSPCAIIQGSNERLQGQLIIRDLIAGSEIVDSSREREDYLKKQTSAQIEISQANIVEAVRYLLERRGISYPIDEGENSISAGVGRVCQEWNYLEFILSVMAWGTPLPQHRSDGINRIGFSQLTELARNRAESYGWTVLTPELRNAFDTLPLVAKKRNQIVHGIFPESVLKQSLQSVERQTLRVEMLSFATQVAKEIAQVATNLRISMPTENHQTNFYSEL